MLLLPKGRAAPFLWSGRRFTGGFSYDDPIDRSVRFAACSGLFGSADHHSIESVILFIVGHIIRDFRHDTADDGGKFVQNA